MFTISFSCLPFPFFLYITIYILYSILLYSFGFFLLCRFACLTKMIFLRISWLLHLALAHSFFFYFYAIILEQSCYNQKKQQRQRRRKKMPEKNLLIIYVVHTLRCMWRYIVLCYLSVRRSLSFIRAVRLLFLICEPFFCCCCCIAITNRHLSTKIRFITGHSIKCLIECKWHIKQWSFCCCCFLSNTRYNKKNTLTINFQKNNKNATKNQTSLIMSLRSLEFKKKIN